ncbi:hypothetical protein JTE90_023572 [Oedothorax gibbosus]|uniref:Transmembrane protein n=1 Tax=Oedothorax gibbosus TaxID=931172 RepID=A0AAV6UB06_9ARAC|nr:hypothetical protein JTE90_023572 [Oedothorax gibbosus]
MDKNDSKPGRKGVSASKENEIPEFEEDEIKLNLELEEMEPTALEEKSVHEMPDSETNNSKNISGANNKEQNTRPKQKENTQEGTSKSGEDKGTKSQTKTNASSELENQQKPNTSVAIEEEEIETEDTELEDKLKKGTLAFEENNGTKSQIKTNARVYPESEKQQKPNSSVAIQEEEIEIEDTELENKMKKGNLELEDEQCKDTAEDEETAVSLLVGESVSINMQGKSPSVRVLTADGIGVKPKKKESLFSRNLITRLRNSWAKSTNVYDFLFRVVLIVFSTLGWILCSGGLPFVSIAMFIIGSVYINDCKVQPNIPLYLIVGGVFGTIQHFVSFWNKCVPESRQGRLSNYQIYYSALDGAITLFLLIWFIIGCAWVYGVRNVEFQDEYKDEYCHKTVYYFAFWLLNINFILIALVAVLSIGLLLFVIIYPKEDVVAKN